MPPLRRSPHPRPLPEGEGGLFGPAFSYGGRVSSPPPSPRGFRTADLMVKSLSLWERPREARVRAPSCPPCPLSDVALTPALSQRERGVSSAPPSPTGGGSLRPRPLRGVSALPT